MAKKTKQPAQDEIEIPDIKRGRPELPLRCGQCLYLKRYAVYARPCEEFGTVPASLPCRHFTPDPAQMGNTRVVRDVLGVLSQADDWVLHAALMAKSRGVRRAGLRIGQVVYFRVYGSDYLCNYATALVTGVQGERVVLLGAHNFVAMIHRKSLMGRTEWESKRDTLIKRNRINDPSGGVRRVPVRGRPRLVSWEPPELRAGTRKAKGPRSSFDGKRKRLSKQKGPIVLSTGDAR